MILNGYKILTGSLVPYHHNEVKEIWDSQHSTYFLNIKAVVSFVRVKRSFPLLMRRMNFTEPQMS